MPFVYSIDGCGVSRECALRRIMLVNKVDRATAMAALDASQRVEAGHETVRRFVVEDKREERKHRKERH